MPCSSTCCLPDRPAAPRRHPSPASSSGDLDGRIPVTLSLAQDGERVHGILVYQRIGNDIAIDSQITPDGALTLTETGAAGKRTGR